MYEIEKIKRPFIKGDLLKKTNNDKTYIYNESNDLIFSSSYALSEEEFFQQLNMNSQHLHDKYVVCPYCGNNRTNFAHIFDKKVINNIMNKNNISCSVPFLSILSCKCGFYACLDCDKQEFINCDKNIDELLVSTFIENSFIEEDF